MGPGEAIVGVTFFASIASIFILRGPLGRALADRLAGRTARDEDHLDEVTRQLAADVENLRHRLSEVEERQDFAERLLAQARGRERLAPGNE
jgi:predicted nuclease with TOPRIM domain